MRSQNISTMRCFSLVSCDDHQVQLVEFKVFLPFTCPCNSIYLGMSHVWGKNTHLKLFEMKPPLQCLFLNLNFLKWYILAGYCSFLPQPNVTEVSFSYVIYLGAGGGGGTIVWGGRLIFKAFQIAVRHFHNFFPDYSPRRHGNLRHGTEHAGDSWVSIRAMAFTTQG